jgi:hypothetical protein
VRISLLLLPVTLLSLFSLPLHLRRRYRQGTEVFNSYGRRANDNLLLDYGFALPENEWEEVTFHWKIPTPDQIGYQRLQMSRAHRFSPLHRIVLHQRELPLAVTSSSFYLPLSSLTVALSEYSILPHRCLDRIRDRVLVSGDQGNYLVSSTPHPPPPSSP